MPSPSDMQFEVCTTAYFRGQSERTDYRVLGDTTRRSSLLVYTVRPMKKKSSKELIAIRRSAKGAVKTDGYIRKIIFSVKTPTKK